MVFIQNKKGSIVLPFLYIFISIIYITCSFLPAELNYLNNWACSVQVTGRGGEGLGDVNWASIQYFNPIPRRGWLKEPPPISFFLITFFA